MDPLYVSAVAVVLGAVSLGVTLSRRSNHVVTGLRSELDLALSENKRLLEENAKLVAELHDAKVKLSPEKLEEHARMAVAYAEQLGGDGPTKLRTALAASLRLDRDANGRQDWTDAQHRIAIEAVLSLKVPSKG
jgi:hypothetical protein